jgi:hypothetical protein
MSAEQRAIIGHHGEKLVVAVGADQPDLAVRAMTDLLVIALQDLNRIADALERERPVVVPLSELRMR